MISSLLLMAAAATAQPINCDNEVTQAGMNQCSARQYAQADQLLNAQWRLSFDHAKRSGGNARGNNLLNAQRAWLKYRDAHCNYVAGPVAGAGSIRPLILNSCLTELTELRTAQLKDLAKEN